jgi:FixJ family two-component response regulator
MASPCSTEKDSLKRAAVVHIVDDDVEFQTAVCGLLRGAGYDARSYLTARDFLLRQHKEEPACILLEVHLPGPTGLKLLEELARRSNPVPVVMISGHADVQSTVRAMKLGALDFLTKPVPREILLKSVAKAVNHDLENRRAREILGRWRGFYVNLTPREREVFERVVAGRMNKEVAADLGISERTAKAHRASLMRKMHAKSVTDLVHMFDKLRSGGLAPSKPQLSHKRSSDIRSAT